MKKVQKQAATLSVLILRNNLQQLLEAIDGIEGPDGPMGEVPEIGELFLSLMAQERIFSPILEGILEMVVPSCHPLKEQHRRLSQSLATLVDENIDDLESALESIGEAQDGIIVTMDGGGDA